MKAVLLGAGRGTRLPTVPVKAMVEIDGEPLLARQLRYLAMNGCDEIWVTIPSRVDGVWDIEAPSGASVIFAPEAQPLGTAGAVGRLREALAGEPFIVLAGDVLTDASLWAIAGRGFGRDGAIACTMETPSSSQGSLEVGVDGVITSFIEKAEEPAYGSYVNASIYYLGDAVLDLCQPGMDFGHDVFPLAIASGLSLAAHPVSEYVQDVGTPEGLLKARADVAAGRVKRWV